MQNDPYLIPGQPCEVWDDANPNSKQLVYFAFYGPDNKPRFTMFSNEIQRQVHWLRYHYRPIGTEWDLAPDWAVCSTVDADGGLRFWKTIQLSFYDFVKAWSYTQTILFCPDKSRYEGEAWKKSKRKRPVWAGGEK